MNAVNKWLDANCLTIHNEEYCKISSALIRNSIDFGIVIALALAVACLLFLPSNVKPL